MAESRVTSLRANYTPLAVVWSIGMIACGVVFSTFLKRKDDVVNSAIVDERKIPPAYAKVKKGEIATINKKMNLKDLKKIQRINT